MSFKKNKIDRLLDTESASSLVEEEGMACEDLRSSTSSEVEEVLSKLNNFNYEKCLEKWEEEGVALSEFGPYMLPRETVKDLEKFIEIVKYQYLETMLVNDIVSAIVFDSEGFSFFFDGDLSFSFLKDLKSLPFSSLELTGSLILSGMVKLESLPDKLSVGGDLKVTNCSSLDSLPSSLFVEGDLSFSFCDSMKELPEDIVLGGDCDLSNTVLEKLPESLSVFPGSLYLNDSSIEDLSNLKVVNGDLCLERTPIKALPDSLKLNGDLHLIDCDDLESFGDNIEISGYFNFYNCPKVRGLGAGFKVASDVGIGDCDLLESLPDDMIVEGYIEIEDCESFNMPDEKSNIAQGIGVFDSGTGLVTNI